jgi:hypothetical protein
MRKHKNLIDALHYSRAFHGKPSETSSFFNELLRSSLAKWFTLHEKLKFGVQKAMVNGSMYMVIQQNVIILDRIYVVGDELIDLLQKIRTSIKFFQVPLFNQL